MFSATGSLCETFIYSRYFPNSKNALKFINEEKDKIALTFRDYAISWYSNNRISWKPSVQKYFQSTMNRHLLPYFGDKPLQEITKWMVKEFRTKIAELQGRNSSPISNKRINNILAVLRLILNEAAEQFDLTSPFINLKPLPIRKSDIMPFSLDEVFLFLKTVRSDFYNYYVVRFFTGMRTAEIDGLKWKYVDFKSKKILVRETWQNRQWVSPKT